MLNSVFIIVGKQNGPKRFGHCPLSVIKSSLMTRHEINFQIEEPMSLAHVSANLKKNELWN